MKRFLLALALVVGGGAVALAAPLPVAADRNQDGMIVIACLGDSNTASDWQAARENGFPEEAGWCEQLGRSLAESSVRTVNMGEGGATVSPHPIQGLYPNHHFEGASQLEQVLARHPVDLAILAFGTNDVLPTFNGIPVDIVDNYTRVWRQARAAGVPTLVALTPTAVPHPETGVLTRSLAAISETNQLLRERFFPYHLVAFDVGPEPENFMDDVHLSAEGHQGRARAAVEAVTRLAYGLGPPAGVRAVRWSRGHWGPKVHSEGESPADEVN